jgi:cytochrome c oxidase cbb3-type subunit 3
VSAETHAARGRGAPEAPRENVVVHTYDDIEEYDNHLPNWWLYTLYGAMVFALFYLGHYHVLRSGPSSAEAYEQEMAADRAAAAERARGAGTLTPEALLTLSRDPATVRQGREVFAQNCVACHAPTGGGGIGPNLTDRFWINGGAPDRVYRSVSEGVPARGMPAWGAQLGARRVQSAVAFVLTLRNTNVTGGKAPQGNEEP